MATQLPSRSFSPPLSLPSPSTLSPPSFPNKRPRLSSNPTSPLGLSPRSPPPSQSSSLPVTESLTNGTSTMPSQATGTMGPPSRPAEKATDTAELTDVVAQSGIDIRDEEKYLTASFSRDRLAGQRPAQSGPFTSKIVIPAASPVFSPTSNAYVDTRRYSQNQQGHVLGTGPFGHVPLPQTTTEKVGAEQRKAYIRKEAEAKASAVSDPFLHIPNTMTRAGTVSRKQSLLPPELPPDAPQSGLSRRTSTYNITGIDGRSIVRRDDSHIELAVLTSLAAQERIRCLVEDACVLAMGRRNWSSGAVPAEWSDIAIDNGGQPEATSTVQEKDVLSAGVRDSPQNPLKRSYSAANLPTPVSVEAQSPTTPVVFPNELVKKIHVVDTKQCKVEEARLAKRTQKTASLSKAADSAKASPLDPGTPVSGPTIGLLGERAPEVTQKKAAKKGEGRKAHAKVDEAVQHRSANTTANMMLGFGGGRSLFGKSKSYSWMNSGGGRPGLGTANRASIGEGQDTTTASPTSATVSAVYPMYLPGQKRPGGFNEALEKGPGIQIRDLTRVLVSDSQEKIAVTRTISKMR